MDRRCALGCRVFGAIAPAQSAVRSNGGAVARDRHRREHHDSPSPTLCASRLPPASSHPIASSTSAARAVGPARSVRCRTPITSMFATATTMEGVYADQPVAQPMSLTTVTGAERMSGTFVSANFFDVLGVRPALGSFFNDAANRSASNATVVLSHRFWRLRFNGDPAVAWPADDDQRCAVHRQRHRPRSFSRDEHSHHRCVAADPRRPGGAAGGPRAPLAAHRCPPQTRRVTRPGRGGNRCDRESARARISRIRTAARDFVSFRRRRSRAIFCRSARSSRC